MSEEKLYAVKNDEGQYWDFEFGKFRPVDRVYHPADFDKEHAKAKARDYGGHVVVLTEEPEKVVLSKEQAQIVEDAHGYMWPAKYIADNTDGGYESERLLMDAFVNGYTVAKEKKYNVKVPHTKEAWYYKSGDTDLLTICPTDKELRGKFTESEIEHYGLQDCEKEEVTEDGMGC